MKTKIAIIIVIVSWLFCVLFFTARHLRNNIIEYSITVNTSAFKEGTLLIVDEYGNLRVPLNNEKAHKFGIVTHVGTDGKVLIKTLKKYK